MYHRIDSEQRSQSVNEIRERIITVEASRFTRKLDRNTESMFYISFKRFRDKNKRKQIVHSLARVIIATTARASSIFLSSFSINNVQATISAF